MDSVRQVGAVMGHDLIREAWGKMGSSGRPRAVAVSHRWLRGQRYVASLGSQPCLLHDSLTGLFYHFWGPLSAAPSSVVPPQPTPAAPHVLPAINAVQTLEAAAKCGAAGARFTVPRSRSMAPALSLCQQHPA